MPMLLACRRLASHAIRADLSHSIPAPLHSHHLLDGIQMAIHVVQGHVGLVTHALRGGHVDRPSRGRLGAIGGIEYTFQTVNILNEPAQRADRVLRGVAGQPELRPQEVRISRRCHRHRNRPLHGHVSIVSSINSCDWNNRDAISKSVASLAASSVLVINLNRWAKAFPGSCSWRSPRDADQ